MVLQFGIPRKTGKDGTYDSELYIHRTGRAGRFGNTYTADVIVLYDRARGEGTTLTKLQEEMRRLWGVEILPRTLPSPREVMEASYERAFWRCKEFQRRAENEEDGEGTRHLVQFFMDKLFDDFDSIDDDSEVDHNGKETLLLRKLATAMAALSGLEEAVPPRSLLTADPRDRTIRAWTESCNRTNPLSPPEVTQVVKALGSGKLGRIYICEDGSAVFDLGTKRAEQLLKKSAEEEWLKSSGWYFEIPSSLPPISV